MKEHDGNIPVDSSTNKDDLAEDNTIGATSTMNDEEKIETELMLADNDSESEERESNWDGSESEFVENDDAEEYEEQYAGIKFGYALKKDEIISCLKHSGMYRFNGVRSIVETCLLAVLSAIFFILFYITKNNLNLILGMISVCLILGVIFVPRLFVKFNAEKLTTGRKLSVEIYPDEIEVDSGLASWKIPLDGTCSFEEFNDMFLIYLPQEKLFIIPIRAIEPDFLADVQGMILAGTVPKEEE